MSFLFCHFFFDAMITHLAKKKLFVRHKSSMAAFPSNAQQQMEAAIVKFGVKNNVRDNLFTYKKHKSTMKIAFKDFA